MRQLILNVYYTLCFVFYIMVGELLVTTSPISVVLVRDEEADSGRTPLDAWLGYLHQTAAVGVVQQPRLPHDLSAFQAVIWASTAAFTAEAEHNLLNFVRAGGGCLALAGPDTGMLPDWFGVDAAPVGPEGELRVLFSARGNPMATRLPAAAYLQGRYAPLQICSEEAETILYADWRYQHSPMLVTRAVGAGHVATTSLHDFANPWLQRVLYRQLRQLAGIAPPRQTLGIGLLGYSPAVGQLHGTGAQETAGLELRAVCDLNPQALAAAQRDFPGVHTHNSATALRDDPMVQIVIITTPPNTHADLAVQMLESGKHVICEKPLALTAAEANAMQEAAAQRGLHLGCHQNRRWDADYRAIRGAIESGAIGDLFYGETFVGGFHHPCGYWHSHDAVSGGTPFDWGAHYLDWMLTLLPDPVTAVVSTRHKRVWHDVTNADQERIQLRFAGGQEAEFIHSDIAAARKPKWYLLGTAGAIVGQWRDVTSYHPDALHYFTEHDIPATEMPPVLTIHRRRPTDPYAGESDAPVVEQALQTPPPLHFPFHANLADHLLLGEPIVAPVAESARVVGVLEAATRSAARGGAVEAVCI